MAQSSSHVPPDLDLDFDRCQRQFEENGYLVFRNVVDPAALEEHTNALCREFDRLNESGPLFEGGGGMIMGHLNCFPGVASRFAYDTLDRVGLFDLVRKLFPGAQRAPNIGCNFNLPGSSSQNFHIDGYFDSAFPVVNVASVDTTLVNGAFNILERTHKRPYKYWQLVVEHPISARLPMNQGDVLIRTSVLWHRGTENRSSRARPMLAYSWEDGGNKLADPYSKNDGQIAFYPNRYATNLVGRLREHAYVAAPGVNAGLRFVQSLVA